MLYVQVDILRYTPLYRQISLDIHLYTGRYLTYTPVNQVVMPGKPPKFSGISHVNRSYIYIYPFWRAIYGSDNFLQIPPMYELFNFIYFRRRGLYRCIEPSISEIHMILPASAGKFIYISEIYMILPASAGNFIYISN